MIFFEIEEKRKEKTKNETMLSSINKKRNIAGAEYKLIEGGKHRNINFSRCAIYKKLGPDTQHHHPSQI